MSAPAQPEPELMTTAHLDDPALGVAIRRGAAAGAFVRIRRGAFLGASDWAALDGRDRHRVLVQAVAPDLPTDVVVSHRSAVAMHRLPWIGSFGARVTVTDPRRDRGQAKGSVERIGGHGRRPATVLTSGVRIATLAETAVDIATREHPWRAIVVLDAVLRRGVGRAEILERLSLRAARNARAARELVDYADAASESAGESITRWGSHVLGAPPPVLQHEFQYEGVLRDRVDLWFPDERVVVEFDGRVKYVDPRTQAGRSGSDVLFDEKRREDRLRQRHDVDGFARVTWADAMPGGQLPRILDDAGIALGPNWMTAWRGAARRTLQ